MTSSSLTATPWSVGALGLGGTEFAAARAVCAAVLGPPEPIGAATVADCVAAVAEAPERAVAPVIAAYAHGGWAIAAAAVAAGPDADRLGDFDELRAAVSGELARRFAREVLRDAAPRAQALEGWPAPGEVLVAAACNHVAEEIAAAPEPHRAAPGVRFHASLDAAAEWLAIAPVAPGGIGDAVDGRLAIAALLAGGTRAWSWAALDAWRTGDPLAHAKALARTTGLGAWIDVLEHARAAIARELDAQVLAAWRSALAAAAREIDRAPSPIVDAIAAIAEHAIGDAAARIGRAAAARASRDELAALFGELLGDPRACARAWEPAAGALRRLLAEVR